MIGKRSISVATTTSRFQLCDAKNLPSPGQCGCCGAYDRPSIHWGHDEDFVGVFLLCINCVQEAASQFEVPVETDLTAAKELIKNLMNELDRTRDALVTVASGIAVDLIAFRKHSVLVDDALPIANGARKG
jgi:hypothetical protein